jgi:hypothetical protein
VLHGIDFKFPIFAGDIVTFESKVISVGRSTLTVYTKMYRSREPEKIAADGFATFSTLYSEKTGFSLNGSTETFVPFHDIGQCWYASIGIKYLFN